MNDLMNQIYQYSFAVDDVHLYLDTHPDDQEALNYYRTMRESQNEAVCAYEKQFGPLTADRVRDCDNYWTWINDPWPWEGGAHRCGSMKKDCNTR